MKLRNILEEMTNIATALKSAAILCVNSKFNAPTLTLPEAL